MNYVIIVEPQNIKFDIDTFVKLCEDIITVDWKLKIEDVIFIILDITYPISFMISQKYQAKVQYHKLKNNIDIGDMPTISYNTSEKRDNKLSQFCHKMIMLSNGTDKEAEQTELWKKINGSKYHFNVQDKLNTNVEQKYEVITRDLQEIINTDLIMPILRKRNLKLYWGTAPTSTPHIGYLYPLMKIADLLKAGCEITILIADLHAFLDNMKSPLSTIEKRAQYYIELLKCTLTTFSVDVTKIKFICGSEFQLEKGYTMDVYKLGNLTKNTDAIHAGTEVVKKTEDPLLTSMLYPLLQSLDEEYLDCDGQLNGNDQRKINVYASEWMTRIGYKKRFYLMNPIIGGLTNVKTNGEIVKMSSSDVASKICLDESASDILKKIKKIYCADGDIEDNSILKLMKNLVFKILDRDNNFFVVNRPEKYGGKLEYKNYADLESDFKENVLCAVDLKLGLTDFLVKILDRSRSKMMEDDMIQLKKDSKY